MPIYAYQCPSCRWVDEQHRQVDERNDPLGCRQCGALMTRKFQPAGFSIEGRAYIEYGGDPNNWFTD